jgi:hypothetical protein
MHTITLEEGLATLNLLQKSYHTSPQPFRMSVFSQPFFTRLTA